MSQTARTLRALPTLLRIGVAETVAYRGEFLVWILTTTLPLVMLGLWTSVAEEARFRGYSSADFVAYYLSNLIVRNLTGSWVAWQVSEEIRLAAMSMRLLRPLHPFVAFAASHLAAIPFRSVVVLPVAVALLVSSGTSALTTEALQLALLVPSLALAWIITFSVMFMIGAIAFFVTKTMALLNLYAPSGRAAARAGDARGDCPRARAVGRGPAFCADATCEPPAEASTPRVL